ncbi:MAG: hypothetical protein COZ16_05565 [Flavobacteriaceae bacterium CG_4_10_14_3_um_filter_31_253]|nr:MAG: hypothetical protein COZ16_05565 [Flavobacteriaceae bacterium CG_4_10_14_3_um_filter_31_253]
MAQPLINGNLYSWSQIELSIAGLDIYGVTSIEYTEEEETEMIYGAGNRPVGRAKGNITSEGSVTLQMEEIQRLQDSSTSGRLQDIEPFSVIVAYLKPNGDVVTDTLRECVFVNNGRSISQNDKSVEQDLTLSIGFIEWNSNPIIS